MTLARRVLTVPILALGAAAGSLGAGWTYRAWTGQPPPFPLLLATGLLAALLVRSALRRRWGRTAD